MKKIAVTPIEEIKSIAQSNNQPFTLALKGMKQNFVISFQFYVHIKIC